MRSHSLLHALAQPSQSSSRLSAIRSLAIRIALSAGKMGTSRKRNDGATKRLPYPALVAFGRDSDTRRVAGQHPDAGRLSGDIRTHHALSGDFWTLKRLRASESCPRTLVMSENRPRIPRRPDAARQMQRNYHNAIDTQENAAMSASKDTRLPHVRAHASTFRIIS